MLHGFRADSRGQRRYHFWDALQATLDVDMFSNEKTIDFYRSVSVISREFENKNLRFRNFVCKGLKYYLIAYNLYSFIYLFVRLFYMFMFYIWFYNFYFYFILFTESINLIVSMHCNDGWWSLLETKQWLSAFMRLGRCCAVPKPSSGCANCWTTWLTPTSRSGSPSTSRGGSETPQGVMEVHILLFHINFSLAYYCLFIYSLTWLILFLFY